MEKNYLPVLLNCIDQKLFSGNGIVMLSEAEAENQCQNCQKLPDTQPAAEKLFREFIIFMSKYNPLNKLDLLEGNLESRYDPYDKMAYYSVLNFVSRYEMSSMFMTGNPEKVLQSEKEARALELAFQKEAARIRS